MLVRRTRSAAALLAAAVALTACASQSTTSAVPAPAAAASSAVPSASSASSSASSPLTITDPWVKTTEEGMTAAFGTLVNNTDTDVTVVSGASPLSPEIELHEVVDSGGEMVMRPKAGGFTVPARGTHPLQPGGDHIMLMGVTEKVEPGAQIAFTLTLSDGSALEFTAVGKDFAGGEEDYRPGGDMDGDMDMGGHDDKGKDAHTGGDDQ
ncbi:copper metallochaperone [Planomonospora sphaerica]|uniref:Copper metallochaperone n=1 Tax=Planomonospora sphaerica TaxID=161355 RepID=A0A171DIH6_9ACTN|nr:copper chaperone PCu(A)C [Planomonospora sphaerica]GAT68707.1 copper metallochaperone [Planomonospora sphaerica]